MRRSAIAIAAVLLATPTLIHAQLPSLLPLANAKEIEIFHIGAWRTVEVLHVGAETRCVIIRFEVDVADLLGPAVVMGLMSMVDSVRVTGPDADPLTFTKKQLELNYECNQDFASLRDSLRSGRP